MKYKANFIIMLLCVLILSACQGDSMEDVQINVQETSETPIPATATITSTATIDVLKTALAKVTKTAIFKLTEKAIATSTAVPTETTVSTELPTPQSFGWDAYGAISFEEFLKEHDEELSFYNAGLTFFSEKYKVKAIYLFEHREISIDDKEKIVGVARNMWGASQSEEINTVFQEELLFDIEGNQYWLPVHALLVDDYEELAVNQEIEVYIIVMAVIHEEDSYSWVIINTAFVE